MQFDIDWLLLQWIGLRKPLLSVLATCLYVCTIGEKIPSSINEQAVHYDKYLSKKESPNGGTKQKNATDEFVKKVKDFEANTSGKLKFDCCHAHVIIHGRSNRGGHRGQGPPVLQKLILPEIDIL